MSSWAAWPCILLGPTGWPGCCLLMAMTDVRDCKQKHGRPLLPRHETGILSLVSVYHWPEQGTCPSSMSRDRNVYLTDDEAKAKGLMNGGVKSRASNATCHTGQCPFPLLPHQFFMQGSGNFLKATHCMCIENKSAWACFFFFVEV